MLNREQALLKTKPLTVRSLYDSYAGMLLGYIIAIVKDKQVAESYLIKIFSNISEQFDQIDWEDGNPWQHLRHFARQEMAVVTNTVKPSGYDVAPDAIKQATANKYLDKMTGEQRRIFCSVYYHRYTITQLAAELGRSEDSINKVLKEAFAIIKQSHES